MTLLNTPSPASFDQPFELLSACHARLERSLALLLRLQAHVAALGAVDQAARDAAHDVLRYFDLAAPHHHEDEERHVLPLLRQQGHGGLADQLASDHRGLDAAYQALRPGLIALRDDGLLPDTRAWLPFATAYRRHVQLEEDQAYPLAQAVRDADREARMGAEMATRRGG